MNFNLSVVCYLAYLFVLMTASSSYHRFCVHLYAMTTCVDEH